MSNISITNNSGGITPVDPDIEFIQGNDGINVGRSPRSRRDGTCSFHSSF